MNLQTKQKSYSQNVKTKRLVRISLWGTFFVYCLAVVYILILSRPFLTFYTIPEFFELKANLVPMRTVMRYVRQIVRSIRGGGGDISWALKQLLGNFALFLPMGAFLPVLFKKMDRFWKVLLVLTFTVIAAEIAQTLLRVGCSDVDDLLLNVTGGILGYLIIKIPFIRRTIDNIRS